MAGKLILFCGPSGSGKTTIVHHLLAHNPQLKFSVSATTRTKRANETDGVDYHFLSVEDFKRKITNDEFVEWEEVYTNGFYGTLKSEIEKMLNENKVPVFDVDVEGGLNIKKKFGEQLLSVFVKPPTIEVLRNRLHKRETETQESLTARITKAETELTYSNLFDKVIVNDKKERAFFDAQKLVDDFLSNPKSEIRNPKSEMKIGLYFGSFNPVHNGHFIIANYMAEFTDLEQVWMVISPRNPLKQKQSMLQDYHRLALVRLGIDDNRKLKASDIEFKLPKPSYTITTLVHLQEKFPQHKFVLIMGEDNLETFHKWKNFEEILEQYEIYIYPRPNAKQTKFHPHPKVKLIEDVPLMEISSTFIRSAIKKKKDVRYMMPEKVWENIREMHFYEK